MPELIEYSTVPARVLPVILMTGAPAVETAILALDHGGRSAEGDLRGILRTGQRLVRDRRSDLAGGGVGVLGGALLLLLGLLLLSTPFSVNPTIAL
mgnify:CR=1 FL=1